MYVYNLTVKDLINLCGGIPSAEVSSIEIEINSVNQGVLNIQIVTNLYQTNRLIDFDLKIINNSYMHVYHNKRGLATRLFYGQVKEAYDKGFKKIYTTAMGREAGTGWGGYYCWGRLGYEMIAPDREEFIELMQQFGRYETTLYQLLSTEDGRIFWLAYGFGWSGQFYLDDSHNNMRYLQEYIKQSGLDY